VANPGFESSLSGWGVGNTRTTIARDCTVAHSGSCSAEVRRTKSTGEAVLDDSPNTVSSSVVGATYSASAWVQVPGGRSVTLRVREFRGPTLVRSKTAIATGTGGWQQLAVTSAPADGGNSISVDVLVSLPTSLRARVDDLALRRA